MNDQGGSAPVSAAFDAAVCEQEAFETPDAIQPHGALLAARADGTRIVTHASANLADFLGHPAQAVLGRTLDELIGEPAAQALMQGALRGDRPVHGPFAGIGADLVLQAHLAGPYVCIDIELARRPHTEEPALYLTESRLQPLFRASTPTELCSAAVEALVSLCGFDRVFAYRFDAAWNGEVIAESRADHLEPYLGLHFPAVHVPARARRLYERQRVVAVADTSYVPVPLLVDPAATGGRLDLTCAALRSISPRHCEYLRNMNAAANLAVALSSADDGALSGMLLCHHSTPRIAGPDMRAAAALVGRLVSLHLARLHANDLAALRSSRAGIFRRLALHFGAHAEAGDALRAVSADLLGRLQATGAVIWNAGQNFSVGQAPPLHVAERIRDLLQPTARIEAFAVDDLGIRDPELAAHAACASGALLAPLSHDGDAILWFRPQHERTIFWGGNPATRRLGGLDPDVPTPTRDHVLGRCLPWTGSDLVIAGILAAAVREELARRMREMFRVEVEQRQAQDQALHRAVTALRERQGQLQNAEERLEQAQSIAGIGTWHYDVASGNLLWSKEMFRLRGVSPNEFEPHFDAASKFTHPDDQEARRQWFADLLTGQSVPPHEERVIHTDGEERLVRLEGGAATDADGNVRYIAGTFQDITERRQIELRLAHAQRMESLGYLTGGMAHDFNNMLGVIMANLELLQRQVGADFTAEELCAEALEGANSCADLVRSLLAYARQQPLRPKRTDINALVQETVRLLRRTLGEPITIDTALEPALWPATVDAAQLQAALVNLANNARDAMPRGGKLAIATRNTHLDQLAASLQPELEPGDYVVIEVSDTGTGIPRDIIGRIFDPFFTTKSAATGTGLGLSMAFGFAKQSRGNLTVYSEVGVGSTFRLYLPCSKAVRRGAEAPPADDTALLARRGETVLVVEDNAQLRRAVMRQLAQLGYTVMEAETADAALAILARNDRVDLLFSDVVMPGQLDGKALACRACLQRPGLAVLLTSGFSSLANAAPEAEEMPWTVLNKPYNRAKLGQALRDVLNGARS